MRHPLSLRRSGFGVVLLFVLIAPLTVQAKDNWLRVQTKNFTLVGNASEKDMRQVATKLEQFRDVFTRLFSSAKFTSPVPTTVPAWMWSTPSIRHHFAITRKLTPWVFWRV